MNNVQVVNLTGHPLRLTDGINIVVIPSVGRARVSSKQEEVNNVIVNDMTIPILSLTEQQIIGLPEPQEGVMYVVSGIVAANAQRNDVVAPGRLLRENNKGRVLGCRAFVQPAPTTKGTI